MDAESPCPARTPGRCGRALRALLVCAAACLTAAHAQTDAVPPPATSVAAPAAGPAAPADFAGLLAQLPDADFDRKPAIVDRLIALHHPNTPAVLTAFLNGHLYERDADHKVFIAEEDGDDLKLTDPLTLKPAGTGSPDDFDKIETNINLREILRTDVAQFALSDPDASIRLKAVKEMAHNLDDATVAALRRHAPDEKDAHVRKAIAAALAQADLASPDADTRLRAVTTLSNSLDPDVYYRLKGMLATGSDGKPAEADARVRAAALLATQGIQRWRDFYQAVETLFFGLSLGSVLVLAAMGLAITFGVMGVINMAHGELMMIGAYTTYCVQQLLPQHLALSIVLSIPAAFVVAGLFGVAIERGIVRFLYGRPLETLLATFGLSLFLQQLVRTVFSPLNRSVSTPEFMSGTLQINDALSITYVRLYIVIFTVVVFAAVQLILKRTSLGLSVRAVSQNRAMAKAMGIRTEWIDAATFGLGAGIAGVAGVALSQLTNVGPNLGQGYIVDSFMVVVFGGVGNLWGTLIGGMGLGVVSKLMEPLSGAVMAKILVLVFIILFIQRRKQGLFPPKGRAAEGH
jgi:urea transport system permease protein